MSVHFEIHTRIVSGSGALAETRGLLEDLGADRVVLVADRGLAEGGVLDSLTALAQVQDLVVSTVLVDVNPTPAAATSATYQARTTGVSAVLGVGGGSALCIAKAVSLLLTNDVPVLSLEGVGQAQCAPVPMIAVPTTAGSGSEVSNALVLHEKGMVREVVIRGRGYEPLAAILDATALRSLPRAPLVFAALDALTHAFESLWARGGSIYSTALALHAAETIFDALPEAVDGQTDGRNGRGENDPCLQRLLDASSMANLACGNSGLALVHALSSSPVVALPHGFQNGVLLPQVARLNRSCLSVRARELTDRLPALYTRIGFSPSFEAGTADAEAMLAASTGHAFRINNACDCTDDDVRNLLYQAGASRPVSVA